MSNTTSDIDDENKHWLNCWKRNNCGSCLSSKDNCGWCPYSATCVPLPKNGNVLSPIRNDKICPFPFQERYELRTSTFGCNCSTTSFLVSLVTVFSTIAALLLLYLLVKLIQWARIGAQGRNGGWELHVEDDGKPQGHVWVRKSESVFHWVWRKMTGEKTIEETDRIDEERTPLLAGEATQ
ncbi:hypothetical protein EJ08DRAFT_597031 [Tothia fuscella]|uniref:PSI domain-containing protein n=1 Tax=Tothia fuscella TaxID=1048955 RepID=A0A9P4NIA5_9PEZI|nr:hypothetical protein EJ08DRAFT_597031 [Tothia fuscella]